MRKQNSIFFILLLTTLCIIGCNSSIPNTENTPTLDEIAPSISKYTNADLNQLTNAIMTIVKSSVSTESITVEIAYSGETELSFGDFFKIEVLKTDGQWYNVSGLSGQMFFSDVAYTIGPNGALEHSYPIKAYYGTLPVGHYRIIVEVSEYQKNNGVPESQNHVDYYLATEFDIE